MMAHKYGTLWYTHTLTFPGNIIASSEADTLSTVDVTIDRIIAQDTRTNSRPVSTFNMFQK
jgi:hypothetical protein